MKIKSLHAFITVIFLMYTSCSDFSKKNESVLNISDIPADFSDKEAFFGQSESIQELFSYYHLNDSILKFYLQVKNINCSQTYLGTAKIVSREVHTIQEAKIPVIRYNNQRKSSFYSVAINEADPNKLILYFHLNETGDCIGSSKILLKKLS